MSQEERFQSDCNETCPGKLKEVNFSGRKLTYFDNFGPQVANENTQKRSQNNSKDRPGKTGENEELCCVFENQDKYENKDVGHVAVKHSTNNNNNEDIKETVKENEFHRESRISPDSLEYEKGEYDEEVVSKSLTVEYDIVNSEESEDVSDNCVFDENGEIHQHCEEELVTDYELSQVKKHAKSCRDEREDKQEAKDVIICSDMQVVNTVHRSREFVEDIDERVGEDSVINESRYVPKSAKMDTESREVDISPDKGLSKSDRNSRDPEHQVITDKSRHTAESPEISVNSENVVADTKNISYDSTDDNVNERSGSPKQTVIINKSSQSEDSIFLQCRINDTNYPFLIDTGASRTIISTKLYRKISCGTLRRNKEHRINLRLADGTPLRSSGTVYIPMTVGPIEVLHEMVIADISDSAILGLDFLKQHKCQLHFDTNKVVIDGNNIPCFKSGPTEHVCKVTLSSNCTIPARSEMIVNAKVNGNISGTFCVIEGNPKFQEDNKVQVAASIGSLLNAEIPVRILNSEFHDVLLYKKSTIGYTVPIVDEFDIFNAEDDESTSACPIRRIGEVQNKNSTQHITHNQVSSKHVPEHLEELYTRSTEHLQDAEKEHVATILHDFESAFAKSKDDIGRTTMAEHSILTGDHPPIKQRPRRTPIAFKGEEEKEIQDMLKRGIIRESSSPWASPIVLVKKKDNTTRFCIDYRKLNMITQKDSYPLPRIQDCLDSLGGAKFFSYMDLASGYWQIPVKEEDKAKTAFVSKSGLYEFEFMAFGLVNAPSTFERCMETILRGLQWKTCLIYLDDIIVFSKTFEEHVGHLQEVLTKIRDAGLKLKTSKCHFFQNQGDISGTYHICRWNHYRSREDGINPHMDRAKEPTRVKIFSWSLLLLQAFCERFCQHITSFNTFDL